MISKKIFCLFLALVCVFSMGLTGCGKADNTSETTGGTISSGSTSDSIDLATQPTTPATQFTDPTVQPTTPATQPTTPPTQATEPSADKKTWKDDNTLKILTIGNSFSVDCMQFVYEIASAAGVENIKLGNLYIAGCPLNKHLTNAQEDNPAYTYYTNDSGKWVTTNYYKMSDAIKSENWDFISFQQSSTKSGKPTSYSDLEKLMPIVESLCTNKKVEFIWHMTWAYQDDYTSPYNDDQKFMYESIVGAVQSRIVPNQKITRIVPSGTSIQNARTSYLGDTLNRDGLHLTKDKGCLIAGITMVATTIGIDFDNIDLTDVNEDEKFLQVALESVKNAMENPYQVIQSKITE